MKLGFLLILLLFTSSRQRERAHGWAVSSDLESLFMAHVKQYHSATPVANYVIFLGRHSRQSVGLGCYSACSIATLVPDHRHRGRRRRRSLKSMCDHRDLPSPSNLNDDTISAQSFTLRDGHMPGARDPLCSVCHGRVAMLQRALAMFHARSTKIPSNKAESFYSVL